MVSVYKRQQIENHFFFGVIFMKWGLKPHSFNLVLVIPYHFTNKFQYQFHYTDVLLIAFQMLHKCQMSIWISFDDFPTSQIL